MGDIHTSVKIGGDAAGLKAAAADAKLAIKQLKEQGDNAAPSMKGFFHEMHIGAMAATGSFKGLGMAVGASAGMLPIIAVGVLFEAFKKLEIGKEIFENISDAMGLTNHAFEEELAYIEKTNKATILRIKYEHDLAVAKGLTHEQAIANDKDEILRQTELQKDIVKINEEALQELVRKNTTWSASFNDGLKTGLATQKVLASQAGIELTNNIAKANESILTLERQSNIVSAKGNTEFVADNLKTLKQEVKDGEEIGKAMAAMIKDSQAKEQTIKNEARQKEKDDAGNYLKWIHEKTDEAYKAIDESFKDHAAKEKIITEGQKKSLQDSVRATHELSGAFDALFSGSGNGWQDMQKYMVNFFESMIAEVMAAIVVWTVLDIVSGGGAAGGVGLGKFIGKSLGFAGGTNYAPGGLAMVGEYGPELVNLPRGSQVFNNSQTNNMMGGGEVLIRFENGSLQGYMNHSQRKLNSYR